MFQLAQSATAMLVTSTREDRCIHHVETLGAPDLAIRVHHTRLGRLAHTTGAHLVSAGERGPLRVQGQLALELSNPDLQDRSLIPSGGPEMYAILHKRSVPHDVLAVKGGADTDTSIRRVRVDTPTITIFGEGDEAGAVVDARREQLVMVRDSDEKGIKHQRLSVLREDMPALDSCPSGLTDNLPG